jgi:hypothetical protein
MGFAESESGLRDDRRLRRPGHTGARVSRAGGIRADYWP